VAPPPVQPSRAGALSGDHAHSATFFDFSDAASFDFARIATGLGETIHVEFPFVYDSAFMAVTDLAGSPSTQQRAGTGK
jgi:hypothetical protein